MYTRRWRSLAAPRLDFAPHFNGAGIGADGAAEASEKQSWTSSTRPAPLPPPEITHNQIRGVALRQIRCQTWRAEPGTGSAPPPLQGAPDAEAEPGLGGAVLHLRAPPRRAGAPPPMPPPRGKNVMYLSGSGTGKID